MQPTDIKGPERGDVWSHWHTTPPVVWLDGILATPAGLTYLANAPAGRRDEFLAESGRLLVVVPELLEGSDDLAEAHVYNAMEAWVELCVVGGLSEDLYFHEIVDYPGDLVERLAHAGVHALNSFYDVTEPVVRESAETFAGEAVSPRVRESVVLALMRDVDDGARARGFPPGDEESVRTWVGLAYVPEHASAIEEETAVMRFIARQHMPLVATLKACQSR